MAADCSAAAAHARPPRALTRPRRPAQIELAVGEPPFAHMPLDALALKKVQCAAPVLTVAAGGRDFSEARAPRGDTVWRGKMRVDAEARPACARRPASGRRRRSHEL
jgi:hypothetical protein